MLHEQQALSVVRLRQVTEAVCALEGILALPSAGSHQSEGGADGLGLVWALGNTDVSSRL